MGGMTQAVPSALIRFALVSGDTANTNIATADEAGNDILLGDTIIACIELVQTDNTPTDRTSTTVVTSNGNIQCSVSTANDTLVVWWMAQTAAENQVASPKIMSVLVDGASGSTNITVTGIKTDDALISVLEHAVTTGAATDQTGDCSITSDGNIQCTNATDGDQLTVLWMSRTNVVANASVCVRFTLATMGLSDDSEIAVTGIVAGDTVIAAFVLNETSALPEDEVKVDITEVGTDYIVIDQVSPTVTAGSDIWVFWLDRSA